VVALTGSLSVLPSRKKVRSSLTRTFSKKRGRLYPLKMVKG
jgi:hypothetical protein